jgi:hypothetical protein
MTFPRCLFLLTFFVFSCTQAESPDQAEIQRFLNHYFTTWSSQDMQSYEDCFATTARITFVEATGQSTSQGLTDFIHGQKISHERSPEPMTEVPTRMKIQGDGRVAQAEVRWKLLKGRETITGTDFFTLIRTPQGWKIASLVFYND